MKKFPSCPPSHASAVKQDNFYLTESHSLPVHAWFGACGTSPAVTCAPLQVKIMDAVKACCFGVLSLWSLVLQEVLWLSCTVRSGYRSPNLILTSGKALGLWAPHPVPSFTSLLPSLIPFLLPGASALGLRLKQCLTKLSLALSWDILMAVKLK